MKKSKRLSLSEILREEQDHILSSVRSPLEPTSADDANFSDSQVSSLETKAPTSSEKSRKPTVRKASTKSRKSPKKTSSRSTKVQTPEPPAPEDVKRSKTDYIRLTITLPPEVFDQIQDLSIKRRKAKQPYTFCHLAREAIVEWLDRIEEEDA